MFITSSFSGYSHTTSPKFGSNRFSTQSSTQSMSLSPQPEHLVKPTRDEQPPQPIASTSAVLPKGKRSRAFSIRDEQPPQPIASTSAPQSNPFRSESPPVVFEQVTDSNVSSPSHRSASLSREQASSAVELPVSPEDASRIRKREANTQAARRSRIRKKNILGRYERHTERQSRCIADLQHRLQIANEQITEYKGTPVTIPDAPVISPNISDSELGGRTKKWKNPTGTRKGQTAEQMVQPDAPTRKKRRNDIVK